MLAQHLFGTYIKNQKKRRKEKRTNKTRTHFLRVFNALKRSKLSSDKSGDNFTFCRILGRISSVFFGGEGEYYLFYFGFLSFVFAQKQRKTSILMKYA